MKHSTVLVGWLLVVGAAMGIGSQEAHAQFPYSGTGSAGSSGSGYSPYLNLLRQGGSLSQNYFGLVRPELNFQSSIGALGQKVAQDQQSISNLQFSNLPTTGHQAMFQNLGGYFQSRGGGAGTTTNTQNRTGTGLQGMAGFNQGAFGGGAFGSQGQLGR
jgi:hypothetical protein